MLLIATAIRTGSFNAELCAHAPNASCSIIIGYFRNSSLIFFSFDGCSNRFSFGCNWFCDPRDWMFDLSVTTAVIFIIISRHKRLWRRDPNEISAIEFLHKSTINNVDFDIKFINPPHASTLFIIFDQNRLIICSTSHSDLIFLNANWTLSRIPNRHSISHFR